MVQKLVCVRKQALLYQPLADSLGHISDILYILKVSEGRLHQLSSLVVDSLQEIHSSQNHFGLLLLFPALYASYLVQVGKGASFRQLRQFHVEKNLGHIDPLFPVIHLIGQGLVFEGFVNESQSETLVCELFGEVILAHEGEEI